MNWASWLFSIYAWFFAGMLGLAAMVACYDGFRGLPFQKRIAWTIGFGVPVGIAVFMGLSWLWSGTYVGYGTE